VATKSVSLEEFAGELGDYMRKNVDQFRQGVASGLARSIPMLVRKSPVDTGLYAQSWDFTVGEKSAILGNYAPHAPIIEYGARPFTPPIAPLLQWAKRVTGDPSQPPDYSPRVWALAKATQRKIAAEGIKPRHIMEQSIPEILENIRQEVTRAFK
jgi:hypothetical protein